MTCNILAYGVNGSQMAGGTQELVRSGHRVRAFTRSEAGAQRWKAQGLDVVVGDMGDSDALRAASEGQDALFLHVPIVLDAPEKAVTYGLNALNAAQDAGVRKVIWNTGSPIMAPASETEPNAVILRALKEKGFSFLALVPTLYMENLLGPWTTAGLAEGKLRYPTPAGFRVQWVAAKDFGRVADRALQADLPNEVVALGGPAPLDGAQIAQGLGGVIDRSLAFETLSASDFEAQLSQFTGPQVAAMVAGMYGAIQANPEALQPGFVTDAQAVQTAYGIELTPLSAWAAEHRAYLQS